MIDITGKISTHRGATAKAILRVSAADTIVAIQEKKLAKGDLFEFSRAAGLIAVKRTGEAIPDCHPLPIEFTAITSEIHGLEIHITCEVQTVYKTGVEMEALHGATIAALTMFDMLKPIDKQLEIASVKLIEKKGGKSDYRDQAMASPKTAVVVCSDSVSSGKKEDKAGQAIIHELARWDVKPEAYLIIPDEHETIQQHTLQLCEAGYRLILFTGGTGLSPRDVTPEAIRPLLTREIPGIMEHARAYGQERMPYAMLSRGIAGMIQDTLVLTFPGSTRGAKESMDALFPYVLHLYAVQKGKRHDNA